MTIDKRIIWLAGIATAITAIYNFGSLLKPHIPFALASSLQSEKEARKDNDAVLDERSVNIGVDFYSAQLRQWLATPPTNSDPIAQQQYQETVEDKRRSLRVYEEKWLRIQQSK